MNKQQKIRLGLIAGATVLILALIIVPLFSYRSEGEARVRANQEEYTRIANLAALVDVSKKKPQQEEISLFGRLNREADRLGLTSNIETLRPLSQRSNDEGERIDLRITGLYLNQGIAWLFALESYPDTHLENLTITRNDANLLDMDMVIIRQGKAS